MPLSNDKVWPYLLFGMIINLRMLSQKTLASIKSECSVTSTCYGILAHVV